MKDDLQARVIGQNPAIERLVKAILRSRVGLKDPQPTYRNFSVLGTYRGRKDLTC